MTALTPDCPFDGQRSTQSPGLPVRAPPQPGAVLPVWGRCLAVTHGSGETVRGCVRKTDDGADAGPQRDSDAVLTLCRQRHRTDMGGTTRRVVTGAP